MKKGKYWILTNLTYDAMMDYIVVLTQVQQNKESKLLIPVVAGCWAWVIWDFGLTLTKYRSAQ